MDVQERQLIQIRGRGASHNPGNRFERLHVVEDPAAMDEEDRGVLRTELYRDATKDIIATNDSPDVGFTHSVNPYRGCEHGCSYCFARPFHEYLGFSAGLDFESRIMVKAEAPRLLREALSAKRWKPTPLGMSGVTDPYQPIERRLRITRGCLEVLAEFRNPVAVITKNHLVTRDVDLLAELAAHGAAKVFVSITTLDESVQRVMEPRASAPKRRLAAVETLSMAGVPVGVLAAPMIPGLTDHELPSILKAAHEAGARSAGFIPLRLPGAVAEVFHGWLESYFPARKEKVLGRIRGMRGGKLNDPRFGSRMQGEGVHADQLRAMFQVTCTKLGLNTQRIELSTAAFRRPEPGGQLGFF